MDLGSEIDRVKEKLGELYELHSEIYAEREDYELRRNTEAYHRAQASLYTLNERIEELEAYLEELTGGMT